jgi:hypothetical protein
MWFFVLIKLSAIQLNHALLHWFFGMYITSQKKPLQEWQIPSVQMIFP